MDNFRITDKGTVKIIEQLDYPEVCITFDCSRLIPSVVSIELKYHDCDPALIYAAIGDINNYLDKYIKESRA